MEIKNFFKFLEGKGKEIPLSVKLMLFPMEIKPEELKIKGDLDLSYCTSLVSLPEGLNVGGYLDLFDCTSLVSLPKGLSVTGYLNLSGCRSLVSLPEGLTVGGNLYISKKLLDKYGGEDGVRKFIKDNGGYVKGRILW